MEDHKLGNTCATYVSLSDRSQPVEGHHIPDPNNLAKPDSLLNSAPGAIVMMGYVVDQISIVRSDGSRSNGR